MTRWLREPLLHFAVLGAALFAAYALVRPASSGSSEIVVTQGQVASLVAQFQGTWQRAPSDDERRGLIDTYVREEVLYREGLALGLDRDDPVIRSRIKQKAEIIGEDALAVEPTDADLAGFLSANRAQFEIPADTTFEQIYFDPAKRGASLDGDVAKALAALRQGRSATDLGDRTMLAARLEHAMPPDVTAMFGPDFAKAIAAVPVGGWQGPVRSTYGVHLVRIVQRGTAQTPSLADAREVVTREWSRARAVEMREKFYQSLRRRYTVTIEPAGAR
jgi:hypothetical protein